MFLRVSSLPCASHVDGNLALRLPLPRPSTRCGVVNQQKSRVVEDGGGRWRLVEVGGGGPTLTSTNLHHPPPTSTCLSFPGPLRSTCRGRRGGGVRRLHQRSRWRTSRRASVWRPCRPRARRTPP